MSADASPAASADYAVPANAERFWTVSESLIAEVNGRVI
jgi:hypothetical protein